VRTTVTPVSGPAEVSFLLGATEIDDAGTSIKVPHPDARVVGSTVCFVHRDHLATVRVETDGAGAAALGQRVQPFGERVILSSGDCAPEPRGFPDRVGGRHRRAARRRHRPHRSPIKSGTSLHARWYDPVLARFVGPDDFDPVDAGAAAGGEGGRGARLGGGNQPLRRSLPRTMIRGRQRPRSTRATPTDRSSLRETGLPGR
jgi:hypothetical protein